VILITFDSLAHPGEDLGARVPRPETRKLWNALISGYSGRISILATGITNTPLLLEWLKREGYKANTVDVVTDGHADTKVDRVASFNAVYGKIYWYIDIDPISVAKVAHMGIPTLLLTVPDIVRPEWVDEKVPREWTSLVEEIESQALAKAERTWHEPDGWDIQ
jgi:hypothetical protein